MEVWLWAICITGYISVSYRDADVAGSRNRQCGSPNAQGSVATLGQKRRGKRFQEFRTRVVRRSSRVPPHRALALYFQTTGGYPSEALFFAERRISRVAQT